MLETSKYRGSNRMVKGNLQRGEWCVCGGTVWELEVRVALYLVLIFVCLIYA